MLDNQYTIVNKGKESQKLSKIKIAKMSKIGTNYSNSMQQNVSRIHKIVLSSLWIKGLKTGSSYKENLQQNTKGLKGENVKG